MQKAQQYEDNEQYDQAYEEYKKIFTKYPRDLSVMERLGHLAVMLGKKDEAQDYYSKILEFDATNTMAYEQLMDIYADTDRYKYYVCRANLNSVEQKPENAINDYKKAISHAQEEQQILSARFVLATLYEQIGKTSKAIDEYLKIMDYEGLNEEIYLKLAKLYGFNLYLGIKDRAIYKELFLEGLTVLDMQNDKLKMKMSISHIAAKREIRRMAEMLAARQD